MYNFSFYLMGYQDFMDNIKDPDDLPAPFAGEYLIGWVDAHDIYWKRKYVLSQVS